jgi:deferrochelatase/peroxidase EfeB
VRTEGNRGWPPRRTTPDFTRTNSGGQPVIARDAHIRLASFEHNGGTRILRRGYSFTDGIRPGQQWGDGIFT